MMKQIFLIILLITSTNTYALKCDIPETNIILQNTSNIFIGEVTKIVSSRTIVNNIPWDAEIEIVAKLKILEIVRGVERKYQNVLFSNFTTLGEKYIIFDNSAYSSMCMTSLSTRLDSAGPYLKTLNFESLIYNNHLKEL